MGRKPARALLIVAVFALLAGVSIAENYVARQEYGGQPVPATATAVLFWASFRYYLAWAIVTPGILWLGRRVPLTTRPWLRPVAFHFLVPLAGSVPFFVLAIALSVLAGHRLPPADYFAAHWSQILVMVVATVLPIYWLILGAGTAIQVYRDREAHRLQAAELGRSLETARLDALRMNLHPHFLFNTLNAIASLARAGDTRGVELVIEHLGTLLRLSMETSGRQMVTLDEELALLDEQLAIEEIRFHDRLRVTRRIDPSARGAAVPSLILQPLVENAIAHGLSQRLEAGLLEISARREGPNLHVAIRDDGPGLPPGWRLATGAKRGLRNVMERLQALYGSSFQFDVGNSATGGAVVALSLPFNAAPPAVAGSPDHDTSHDGHR